MARALQAQGPFHICAAALACAFPHNLDQRDARWSRSETPGGTAHGNGPGPRSRTTARISANLRGDRTMTTSLKVLAFGLLALASPAFAHGGGGGNTMGHDMSQGMTQNINHTTTMSQSTWKNGPTHDSKQTDRTKGNTLKQQIGAKIGTEVQALLAKYTLF